MESINAVDAFELSASVYDGIRRAQNDAHFSTVSSLTRTLRAL